MTGYFNFLKFTPLNLYFISFERVSTWLARLAGEYNLFFPAEVQDKVHWQRYRSENFKIEDLALKSIRAAEPVKSFLFSPRERVATFPEPSVPPQPEAVLLFGIKSCDLRGLAVHQKMYLEGDFADPFYASRLKNTGLVVADCPTPAQSCFCNLVGLKPYYESSADFTPDLSLTVLDDGWLIEVLSERGKGLIEKDGDGFQIASEEVVRKREAQRQLAWEKLERNSPQKWHSDLPRLLAERTQDRNFWAKAGEKCVECFGCLLTCPTCFCYLLYDQPKADKVERIRVWDACYMAMFARVGGGANPRPEFIKRFINRFHCKFMNFKNQYGFYACSGCGRCFTACMGKIDIREILGGV